MSVNSDVSSDSVAERRLQGRPFQGVRQMAGESTVLVTGGTGYVGGRLTPLLEQRGLPVGCMARRPAFSRRPADRGRRRRRAATGGTVRGPARCRHSL